MSTLSANLWRVATLIGLLLAWEYASGPLISEFWVSKPSAVFATLIDWFAEGSIYGHILATVQAAAAGYVIGAISGVVFGIWLGKSDLARQIAVPYLSGLYALPKVALAPLFIIVFGIDLGSKIALVVITVFFLVLYGTIDGVRNIDRDMILSLRLMGATSSEIDRKIIFPATLPWILSSMRIAVRYAFTATILGEMIASNRGLGFLIEASAGAFEVSSVFASVSIVMFISVTLTLMLGYLDRQHAV